MRKNYGVFTTTLMLICILLSLKGILCNPIPVPNLIMPREYINITIREALVNGEIKYLAIVDCEYPFRNVNYSAVKMLFPVPEDSFNIHVYIGEMEIKWTYSEEFYSTILGCIPMIEWAITNLPKEFTIKVHYEHYLATWKSKPVLIYALGTGKYLNFHAKETVAEVHIKTEFPIFDYQVYLDDDLNTSKNVGGEAIDIKLEFRSGMFRPFTRDLIFTFSPREGELKMWTDKDEYGIGENVVIILENLSNDIIYLPNAAPWTIIDEDGNTIFSPIAIQVLTPVNPKTRKHWVWNQKDNEGVQVGPGNYTVVLETLDGYKLIAKFSIIEGPEKPGETPPSDLLSPWQNAIVMSLVMILTVIAAYAIHTIKRT